MKLEVVVDASGLPLGLEVAAADVSEQQLLMPALNDVPVEVPPGTPVVAIRGMIRTRCGTRWKPPATAR